MTDFPYQELAEWLAEYYLKAREYDITFLREAYGTKVFLTIPGLKPRIDACKDKSFQERPIKFASKLLKYVKDIGEALVLDQILSEKYNEMYPKKQATETTH